MKALVKTYLNIRTGSPQLLVNNNPGYYNPGDVVEVTATVIGELYKESNTWYKLDNNTYVWSGGVDMTEVTLNNDAFRLLNEAQQYDLLLQAKAYYTEKMLKDEYGVTGIFIGKKVQANQEIDQLCLSFQVINKGNHVEWKKIPAILPFNGYSIPTDVIEEDFLELQLRFPGDILIGKPGGSISRVNQNDWGSCAFIAEREEDGFINFYLVTNYHVAAPDLLLQKKFSYDVSKSDDLLSLVMPSWQTTPNERDTIGFLSKGLFDEWHDTAVIRIVDTSNISNMVAPGIQISGVVDILDDETFLGKMVTMYGGFSGRVSGKKIVSVNSSQRGRIAGEKFIKSELIQVEKMSNGGDSGSPVMIGDQLIGIIIGADRNNTYILSAAKILNFFNLKISGT